MQDLKIMVVDDSWTTRTLLVEALIALGFDRIVTCNDGMDALALMERQAIDVVISDLHMPRVDGMMLYREIKAQPRFADTKFVLATADGKLAELPADYRLGGHRMLRKPYRPEDVAEVMAEVAATRMAAQAGV